MIRVPCSTVGWVPRWRSSEASAGIIDRQPQQRRRVVAHRAERRDDLRRRLGRAIAWRNAATAPGCGRSPFQSSRQTSSNEARAINSSIG